MTKPHNTSVARRLLGYVMLFKRQVIVALVILIVAMAAQLAGPYIAKVIIDDHILAIEREWVELPQDQAPPSIKHVNYREQAFIRADWLNTGERDALNAYPVVHIKQEGASFVLNSALYGSVRLTASESADFYSHDMRPVLLLIGLIILLAIAASVLNFTQSYMLQAVAQRVVQRIRMDVFRNLHRMPVRYFDNTPIGRWSRVLPMTQRISRNCI